MRSIPQTSRELKSTWFCSSMTNMSKLGKFSWRKKFEHTCFFKRSAHPHSLQKRSTNSKSNKVVRVDHKRSTVTAKPQHYSFFNDINSSFRKSIEYQLLLCNKNTDNLNFSRIMPILVCIPLICVSPKISTLQFAPTKLRSGLGQNTSAMNSTYIWITERMNILFDLLSFLLVTRTGHPNLQKICYMKVSFCVEKQRKYLFFELTKGETENLRTKTHVGNLKQNFTASTWPNPMCGIEKFPIH